MNATHLFEQFRHSESYWTSLFALFLRWLSATENNRTINLWNFNYDERSWKYEKSGEDLDCRGLGFGDILVERNLGEFLGVKTKTAKKPDLILCHPGGKLTIIENKTIRHKIGEQIALYHRILESANASYRILLLVSLGYEMKEDWKTVSARGLPSLILWEEILQLLGENNLPFSKVFDVDLTQYCDMELEGQW